MLDDETFFALGHATVAFANLPSIRSAADVEVLFPWIIHSIDPHASDGIAAAVTYTKEQKLLRATLKRMAEPSPPDRDFFRGLVGKDSYWAKPQLVIGNEGFDVSFPAESVPGVKTSWLWFVSELMTAERRRKAHVVECNLVGCNTFLFRERREGHVGRPSHYCRVYHPDDQSKKKKERRRLVDHERDANRLGASGRKQKITRQQGL